MSRVIDTRLDRNAPWVSRWQVVVQSTGQILDAFSRKSTAVAVGRAVARERKMIHWVRNRKGEIMTRRDYGSNLP